MSSCKQDYYVALIACVIYRIDGERLRQYNCTVVFLRACKNFKPMQVIVIALILFD